VREQQGWAPAPQAGALGAKGQCSSEAPRTQPSGQAELLLLIVFPAE
jgi:hypothetical protein